MAACIALDRRETTGWGAAIPIMYARRGWPGSISQRKVSHPPPTMRCFWSPVDSAGESGSSFPPSLPLCPVLLRSVRRTKIRRNETEPQTHTAISGARAAAVLSGRRRRCAAGIQGLQCPPDRAHTQPLISANSYFVCLLFTVVKSDFPPLVDFSMVSAPLFMPRH